MEETEEERRRIEEEDRKLVRWLREKGLDQFARDVNDVRFAHRILDAQRWIDAYDFHVSAEERLQESLEARLISFHAHLFDKAAAYNNVIVSLGYAGFFAIWNFTQDVITPLDNLLIAILLGASLLVFIFWNLRISFHNAVAARKIGEAVALETEERDERVKALNDAETKNQKSGLKIQRWWPTVFIFTVGTGFAAGILLLAILTGKMLDADISTQAILGFFKG